MSKRIAKWLALVMALCMAFALAVPAAAAEDTTLNVGVMSDTDGFDPAETTNYIGCNLVYETLVDMDPATSEPVGILAESWEYQDDTHLYVKLYDDATFSSGNPVTSQDVYDSWYRNVENTTSNSNTMDFIDWDNWEFINDKEFVISYKDVFGPAINYMTMCCFSVIDTTAMADATSEDFWSAPIGSGPYLVKENVSGSYSSYVRNEDYWNKDAMPEATEITINNYSDASTMFIDFETGNLDIAFNLDETDANRVANGDVEDATLVEIATENVHSIAFPEYTEVLSDVRVREALAYAIDVEDVTDIAFGSLGTVASSILPVGIQNALDVGVQEYDSEHAKELLEEAGYQPGDITLHLVIVGAPTNERMATAVQSYWDAIGVTLDIESCDLATAISHFKASETDIVLDQGATVTMDPYEKLMMSLDSSTNATIRITDPDFNASLRAGVATTDEAARSEAYEAAQQWIHDNYRIIPICEIQEAEVFRASKIEALNTFTDECMTLRYVTFVG